MTISKKIQNFRKEKKWLDSYSLIDECKNIKVENVEILTPCVGYIEQNGMGPNINSRLQMLQNYVLEDAFSNMENGNKYFIPFHPHGNHWTVLVVEHYENELNITCFDPFGKQSGYYDENNKAIDLLSDLLLLGRKKTCEKVFLEQTVQHNGWECGYNCLDFIEWASKQENVYKAVQQKNDDYLNRFNNEKEEERQERSSKINHNKDVEEIAFAIASSETKEHGKLLDQSKLYNDALVKAEEVVNSGLKIEDVQNLTESKKDNWTDLIKEQSDLLAQFKPDPSKSRGL